MKQNFVTNKRITFVRHGQGTHMIKKDMSIFDPELTEEGKIETEYNCKAIENENFEVIFVSPLTRTLQTAEIISKKTKTAKIIVLEMIREGLNKNQANKRRNLSELKQKFPSFDFSLITDDTDTLYGSE